MDSVVIIAADVRNLPVRRIAASERRVRSISGNVRMAPMSTVACRSAAGYCYTHSVVYITRSAFHQRWRGCCRC